MRILFSSNSPFVATGYGQQCAIATQRLTSLGHDVAILAFYGLEGSMVDWGNFAYAREKLDKLRAVFDMAKARIPGPLRINMSNFEDGSIPVSALDPRQG